MISVHVTNLLYTFYPQMSILKLIEENAETLKTSTDLLSSQMSVELLLLQIPRKVHSLLGRGLHKYVEQIYRKKSGIQMK